MNSGFAYSPLTEEDGIRILLLQPAFSRDEDLKGSLQHISLAQQYDDLIESYTALSYVWGDPTPVDKILIDGQELGIAANLSSALRDLRDGRRIHKLWADAVCIDQGNIPERSRQVARMGEVYGCANNTIIYLGPLDPYIDAIIRLAREYAHSHEPGVDITEIDTIDTVVLRQDGAPTGVTIPLVDAAYISLLPNPWFRRIWVLQELVLSRVPWIQCGLKRVRWLDLCRLLVPRLEMHRRDKEIPDYVKKKQDEDDENLVITPLETMDHIRAEYHESSNSEEPVKRTLWQVLQSRKGCHVSDPRDIIFAHMGIISDRHAAEKLIRVDYSQEVLEVFVAMGRYVRYHDGFKAEPDDGSTPSLLRTTFSLPSWVPDWGIEIDRRRLCSEAEMVKPALSHVFPLSIWGGAKIIALSGVLPPSSSFEYMKNIPFHKNAIVWNDVVDRLPATTKDSTLDKFGLYSWPREAVRLSSAEYNEKEVLDFQDKMIPYLRKFALSDIAIARLALLNSGMIILVPCAALLGDIVVVPVRDWSWGQSALTVRPCEFRDPTDLSDALKYVGEYENYDSKGCWFLHASLVGACPTSRGVAKSAGLAGVSHREILYGWHVPGLQDGEPSSRSRVLVLH